MVVRPTLQTGKNGFIERVGVFFLAHNHATTRPAQRLMGRRGNDVDMRHRARVHPRGYQPRDMGNIRNDNRTDALADSGKTRKIDNARISRRATEQQFGFVLLGQRLDLCIVDLAVFFAHAVLHGLVVHAGNTHLVTVCQVTTVRQRQPHHHITRRGQPHVDGLVGRRARVGLHVDMLSAKELLGSLDAEHLQFVDLLLAFVVAVLGIALGIFVGKNCSGRF